MTIPTFGRRLVGTELRLDVLEHAHVVERVNLAADNLRCRPHVMASMYVRGHERRVRVDLVQIFDDGHGLDEGSLAIDQIGYQPLGMESTVRGRSMFQL